VTYRYWRPDPPLPGAADVERFWSYVLIGRSDECWPWRTLKRGLFWWRDAEGNKHHQVSSRLAFRLANPGVSLPPDKIVGHRCDWHPCCNPADLELITQQRNSQDMADRGLHPYMTSEQFRATRESWWRASPSGCGESNNAAAHTEEQIMLVRTRYAAGGITQAALGLEFNLSQSQVSRIIRGESWRPMA
jgi:hypothetical protein